MMGHWELRTCHLKFLMGTYLITTLGVGDGDGDRNEIPPTPGSRECDIGIM